MRVELASLAQLHALRGDLEEAERVLATSGAEGSEDFQAKGTAAVARSVLERRATSRVRSGPSSR